MVQEIEFRRIGFFYICKMNGKIFNFNEFTKDYVLNNLRDEFVIKGYFVTPNFIDLLYKTFEEYDLTLQYLNTNTILMKPSCKKLVK